MYRNSNPHRILTAYREEIKSWTPLKLGDSTAYRKFSIKCDSIMSCQQWNSLDTADVLCSLVSKLPGNTRDRWNRKIIAKKAPTTRTRTLRSDRFCRKRDGVSQ